jgi:glucose-6-phosphate dehydrogenase assembly protein OpcA
MGGVSVEKGQDSVESFLSGRMSRVDVTAIQAELRRLWMEAATTGDGAEHPQVSRACSCNLVLFTDDEDAQSAKGAVLDEVVLRNPARAILTIFNGESPNKRLDGWVSARCHMAGNFKQICSEQITIVAEGTSDEELISVIDSLVLGDQPTYLWWTIADLTGDKIGPYLVCASRVIVDSSSSPFSFRYLNNLDNIVESVEGCIGVSDLNWSRLAGIRRALAEEFERSPLSISDLNSIKTIRVWTNGQEFQDDDCSIQALLLVGWLASRLGWTPSYLGREGGKSPSRARFDRTGGGTAEVEFKSMPFEHVQSGAVFQLEVVLEDGRAVEIARDPAVELNNLVVLVRKGADKVRELIADDTASDVVGLVCRELDEPAGDPVFGEALSLAADLVNLVSLPE